VWLLCGCCYVAVVCQCGVRLCVGLSPSEYRVCVASMQQGISCVCRDNSELCVRDGTHCSGVVWCGVVWCGGGSQLDDVRWIDLCGVGMGVEDMIVLAQLMQTNNTATALDLSFNKITQSSSLGSSTEVRQR
jgi:hypothetical protein